MEGEVEGRSGGGKRMEAKQVWEKESENAAATRIQAIQRGRMARSHEKVGESSFNFNDELNEVGCEKCGKTENTIKTVNSKGNTVVYCSNCI